MTLGCGSFIDDEVLTSAIRHDRTSEGDNDAHEHDVDESSLVSVVEGLCVEGPARASG